MNPCPKCGLSNKDSAKFCTKCGSKLNNLKEKPKKKFCTKCGAELVEGKKFCKKCGHPVDKLKQEIEHKKESPVKIPKKVLFIIIGIIALVVLSSLVYNNTVKTGRPPSSEEVTQKPSFTEKIVKEAYCGNKACESGEDSSNCCIDCGCPKGYSCTENKCKKLEECGDGVCGKGESSLNCCIDCGCDSGFYCEAGRCVSRCGDGIKASDENSENCCLDAGCPTGETCQNNVCVLLKPEIKLSFRQSEDHSVTYLKSKSGVGIGTLSLSNTGNDDAQNTKVTITSNEGYFEKKIINVERVSKGSSDSENIILSYTNKILDFSDKGQFNLDIKVEYYNSANQKYEGKGSYMVNVYGRNSLEPYGQGYVSYVTPHHPIIREFAAKSTSGLPAGMEDSSPIIQKLAARWLFESMTTYGINYVNDVPSIGDYVQFPIETLKRRNGDCEDLAVLYSSLLEAIGMKSVLIRIPGHLFAGYMDSDGYLVPVETTASDFDMALIVGLGEYKDNTDKSTLKPSDYRKTYSEVLYGEEQLIPLPDITKQIITQDGKTCKLSFTLSQGWIAKTFVIFSNSGNTVGAGCAAIGVYNNKGNKIDEDLSCWTIYSGETKEVEYIVDITFGDVLSGYYCYGY